MMKGKMISSLQVFKRCRETSMVRLSEGFLSLFHKIADLVVLIILPVNIHRPAFSQSKVAAFIFAVIIFLIDKFTDKNLSLLDCYRFFLLAFEEYPDLELLCSLFAVTNYQFISLTRGICKTLNILSLEYFLSMRTTFYIYSKSKQATVEKSVHSIYLFQTRMCL